MRREKPGLGLAKDLLEIPVLMWDVVRRGDVRTLNQSGLYKNLKTSRDTVRISRGDSSVMPVYVGLVLR